MDDEPQSLKALFSKAEQSRLSLETTTDATSESFLDLLAETISAYEAALKLASQISLFSPNESLEDLPTHNLPYMLISHHLAELLQRLPTTSPSSRADLLRRARAAYEAFLTLLDGYEMLGGEYAKLWERYTDAPAEFSTVGGGSDATARRNAKIANFRAEKALKEKLAALRANPRYLEHGDEELVRELHLANIAFCTHMTFQALESMNRELSVLSQAPAPLIPQASSIAEDERHRKAAQAQEGFSDRLDPPLKRLQSMFGQGGPFLSKDGKPLKPFTIVGSRSELQKGVFRPGHNLPTMSIDEYLDEEKRRGNIIEGGGEASFARPEPDEDNVDKADAETYKAREWDEFKEENPKGAGNTLNRG